MKIRALCFGILFMFATVLPAQAAGLEGVAFVNISKVFDSYSKTKTYDKELEKIYNEYEEQRNAKIQEIRDAEGRLSLLKESERKKLEAEIEEKKNALLEFDRQQQTDIRKKRDEHIREIFAEIEKVINDLAQKEGYSLILNDRVLFYGAENLDLTDKVIELLNK